MAVRFYEYSFCSFYVTHGVVKRSVCVGMIMRERSICVVTTKRIGNVACDVNATRTLRVLFYDHYCIFSNPKRLIHQSDYHFTQLFRLVRVHCRLATETAGRCM